MVKQLKEKEKVGFYFPLTMKTRGFLFGGIAFSLLLATVVYQFYYPEKSSLLKGREERSVMAMYDQDDLSACDIFAGHFINFGYWDGFTSSEKITVEQRVESQKNLYRLVAGKLSIGQKDALLEVACGQGVGSMLVMKEFSPRELHGIDFSAAQIARAKQINLEVMNHYAEAVSFREGSAEHIPYEDERFDKIFSIEAAQHFDNMELFAQEVYRVLKPGGRIAISTFFATSDRSYSVLASMIQTIRDGIDKLFPIYQIEQLLLKNGFREVKVESIGAHVWSGFDQWVSQGEFKDSWTRNWYQGYQNGLIDYYLITAQK